MKKLAIGFATLTLGVSAVAYAHVYHGDDRDEAIELCRRAAPSFDAIKQLDKSGKLSQEDMLYLRDICVAYGSGKIDGINETLALFRRSK